MPYHSPLASASGKREVNERRAVWLDLEICNNFVSHFCHFCAVPFRAVPLVNVTDAVVLSVKPHRWSRSFRRGSRPRHQAKFSGPGLVNSLWCWVESYDSNRYSANTNLETYLLLRTPYFELFSTEYFSTHRIFVTAAVELSGYFRRSQTRRLFPVFYWNFSPRSSTESFRG